MGRRMQVGYERNRDFRPISHFILEMIQDRDIVTSACVADVNDWMTASRLRLNPSKTQVMWLGSSQQLDKINIRDVPLLSASVTVVNTARDLGVILDSQLSLDFHVASVCRSSILPTEAASSSRTVTVF